MTDIQKKKIHYEVSENLSRYLSGYSRSFLIPVRYEDLLRYENSMPLIDKQGRDTLWESVMFPYGEMDEINSGLTSIYAQLQAGGDTSVIEHLSIDRIDYCTFGNSNPFRIRVINNFNDNYDYFYMKTADASRVYGAEIEHILSPNRINYIIDGSTLVEEHIAGIPGDHFIEEYMKPKRINEIRVAKEFIKFNERCFVCLLGDMRSYNFVIDMTPDFDAVQYRIRSIDFDQECYEGKKNMYLPQFFKENKAYVDLCISHITPETVAQYQKEERALIAKRLYAGRHRITDLMIVMTQDVISTPEKVVQLRTELAQHYNEPEFLDCGNMGSILKLNLQIADKDSVL
ncbi:MAG: hypothetical protein HRT71_07480 [Flavobacteriales bacterium]|nr:hypothetical protein [Flavobacteriales bacterium]